MVSVIRLLNELGIHHKMVLSGRPGIGKTEYITMKAMEEAERLGKIFVDLRDADDETLDDIINNPQKYYIFIRIPVSHLIPDAFSVPERNLVKKFVEFLTPKEIKILSLKYKTPDGRKEGIYGVLFIDELTNYYDMSQLNALLSIFQEMEVGFTIRLSKNIKVVSALNPPRYNSASKELPESLRGRISVYEVDPPTILEWGEYMNKRYGDEWEKLVLAYLKVYPQDFAPDEKDYDSMSVTALTCPRKWTDLALLLYRYRHVSQEIKEEIVKANLSKDVATKFNALYRTNIDIVRALEEISRNPEAFNKYDPSPKILISYAVAQRPLNELKKKFMSFFKWLSENDREFMIVIVMMMDKTKGSVFINEPLVQKVIEEISVYR